TTTKTTPMMATRVMRRRVLREGAGGSTPIETSCSCSTSASARRDMRLTSGEGVADGTDIGQPQRGGSHKCVNAVLLTGGGRVHVEFHTKEMADACVSAARTTRPAHRTPKAAKRH